MSNHTSIPANLDFNLADSFYMRVIGHADGTITVPGDADNETIGTWSIDGDTVTIVSFGHFYAPPMGTTRDTFTGPLGGWMTRQTREYFTLDGQPHIWA